MNKKLKVAACILIFLVVASILLKLTGVVATYTMPTTGSEPNVKQGSFIIASNLITPKRGDFVTYIYNDPEFGESTWIHRLCGMENDTIQIIDGTLFVNGKNFDEDYNLKHSYLLNEEQFKSLKDSTIEHFVIKPGSYLTFVDDADAQTHKLTRNRYQEPKTKSDPRIKDIYLQDWNKDHFGPLIIPKGKIFLLGDNRDNSMDSRFTGLIESSAINGVLWKILF